MSYLSQPAGGRNPTALIVSVLVQGLFIAALLFGLSSGGKKLIKDATEAVQIKIDKPKEEPPPPPPVKEQEIPVVTPPPDVVVQQQSAPPPITTTTTVARPYTPPAPVAPSPAPVIAPPAPPAPKPVVAAQGATPKGNRLSWFSNDDYPESAKREGFDQGVTGVTLVINEQGKVESCAIAQTSGNDALDQVTCRLFQRRGRYNPARAEGGAAMKQTLNDRVKWVYQKES